MEETQNNRSVRRSLSPLQSHLPVPFRLNWNVRNDVVALHQQHNHFSPVESGNQLLEILLIADIGVTEAQYDVSAPDATGCRRA